jgi:CheY-like chemotaxis protein
LAPIGPSLILTEPPYGYRLGDEREWRMKPKGTILIVDDDEAHRYTTRLLLEHAGFEVKETATGDEALRLAEEHPDIIILDLHLPDIAGIEICRILKTTPQTEDINVLHVTALYPGAEERSESLAAGADGYFMRPIDPAQLLTTIQVLLARRAV